VNQFRDSWLDGTTRLTPTEQALTYAVGEIERLKHLAITYRDGSRRKARSLREVEKELVRIKEIDVEELAEELLRIYQTQALTELDKAVNATGAVDKMIEEVRINMGRFEPKELAQAIIDYINK